jgi:hypothetical protein
LIAREHHALLLLENKFTVMGMGMQDLGDGTLERIWAESECTRVLHAYGRAIDWQDREGLAALFWPEARIDLGFFEGDGAEAVEFLLANAARSQRRFHATSNVLLRIEGDSALADSCCVTHALSEGEPGEPGWQLFLGRYLDRLERRGGEWRFIERTFLLNGYHAGAPDEPPFLAGVPRAADLAPDHPLFRFR